MDPKNVNKNNMSTIKTSSSTNNRMIDSIINNPESRMRIEIKEVEEFVSGETKKLRINAPLSIEEKVFLSL